MQHQPRLEHVGVQCTTAIADERIALECERERVVGKMNLVRDKALAGSIARVSAVETSVHERVRSVQSATATAATTATMALRILRTRRARRALARRSDAERHA